MRTTLILDDELVTKASKLTGVDEKTKLLHMGLEALIHRESARRLAALGGAMPALSVAPRRKTEDMHDLAKVAEEPVEYVAR
ncbi:MAG: type II toxin-antitoxin system VapB family antitoxin [Roseimicrobium sp.]